MIKTNLMLGNTGDRREHDFYPTPADVTIALMDFLKLDPCKIWEPAAGNGAMVKVLQSYGHEVIAPLRSRICAVQNLKLFDMNKKTSKIKKPNGAKPPVIRSFFAVLPNGTPSDCMSVLLMAKNRKLAITLYEVWNERKFKLTPKLMKEWGLSVVRVQAKNAV